MADHALARITDAPTAVAINRSEYDIMRAQAADLIASGYLPRAIDKPEKAVAIIMLGRELGMGPWQSFNSIDVIQGRPTLKPIGMAALVNRFVEQRGGYLRVVESTGERCVVEYLRPPAPQARRVSFTTAEAQTAGLMGKDTWKQYPQDMLRSRAISRACREGFSDVILGLYTDEEIESIGSVPHSATTATTNVTPISAGVVAIGIETTDDRRQTTDDRRQTTDPGIDADELPREIIDPEPRATVKDERARANARLHAIATANGWTDAAIKLFCVALVGPRESGPTTSRTQLTTQELLDLGTEIEAIGRQVTEEGEIIATPEVEAANAIAAAGDQRALARIAARLNADGISQPWLKKMYARRNREVPAAA
jgi:hypothetical protein